MAIDPMSTRPRTVALVALGPSGRDYVHAVGCKKDFLVPDEVWLINSLAGVYHADKVFIMDDLQEISSRYPAWGQKLRTEETPIVTCRAFPEFPSAVEYPLDDVMRTVKTDWFSNSVAYAIAYAIHIQVKDLYIFGADFVYPGSAAVEPGADCCAYMLGVATMKGVNYKIPQSSTLMDSNLCRVRDGALRRPLYGYDYNPGRMAERVRSGQATAHEALLAAKAPVVQLSGDQHAVQTQDSGIRQAG